MTLRLAMWSGPRNISTAMMRSWGNRPDTVVCDEPLYAHYLLHTHAPHPGAAEVISSQESDWRVVVEWLTGPVPDGREIFFQKHMSHHLLPHVGRDWLWFVRSAFLIRDPAAVIVSLARTLAGPSLADTGLPQQLEIFEWVRRHTGSTPPVLDARDVLTDPGRMLRLVCAAVGVPFIEAMLRWPTGRRDTDGVWAPHWYAEVEKSSCFRAYQPPSESVPEHLQELHAQCLPYYQTMYQHRLGQVLLDSSENANASVV